MDGSSVVGIDPLTGRQKFTVTMDQSIGSGNGNCGEYPPSETSGPPAIGSPIIAGDGYAYFPYAYSAQPLASNQKICNRDGSEIGTGHGEMHLCLLRVGTDGSSSKISVGDWTVDSVLQCVLGRPYDELTGECAGGHWVGGSSGAIPDSNSLLGSLITNADQGVQYSWTLQLPNAAPVYNFSSVSKSGSVSTVALNTPGPVTPVLQHGDSSFSGTASTDSGNSITVHLDQSGHLQWSVPGNYQPKIATADGGVIAQTPDGTAVTLDQNGNATGRLASLATLSWAKYAYQLGLGSAEQFFAARISLDSSLWVFQSANTSANKVAAKHEPTIATFVPVSAADVGLSNLQLAEDGIRKTVPLTAATHLFKLGATATVSEFTSQLAQPIAAVGFIGHAFDIVQQPSGTSFSVGLRFGPTAAIVRAPDPSNAQLNYTFDPVEKPTPVEQINTQAKVVFIGSCFIGPIFEALWNINDTTSGQALIVPAGSREVLLGHALGAWQNILDDMTNKGMTVGDAVRQTNTYLHTLLDNDGKPVPEQYQVIGDGSVKFKQ